MSASKAVALIEEESVFLRWAILHHHWGNTMSVVRYTPLEEYVEKHLEENRILEGLFDKFGITREEVIEHEAEHYAHPSKTYQKIADRIRTRLPYQSVPSEIDATAKPTG